MCSNKYEPRIDPIGEYKMSFTSKAFYITTGETDCYELYSDVNKRVAICDNKEDADYLLQLLNKTKDKIPDPYIEGKLMTDCDIWSEDLIEVLSLQFRNENMANNDATPSQMRDAKKKLRQALIWFYQTHL
jgi:hypothetical protein